eukprot:scpid84712/ scgid1382/ 
MASNVVRFILLLGTIATAFAMVVAFSAVPRWYVASATLGDEKETVSVGLWRFCTSRSGGELGNVKRCVALNFLARDVDDHDDDDIPVWLEAAEAGCILSALALGAGFFSSIFLEMRLASPNPHRSNLFLVPRIMLGLALCSILGTGFAASMFYVVNDLENGLRFGAMYYVCWLAASVTIVPLTISHFHHRPPPVAQYRDVAPLIGGQVVVNYP